MTCHQNPGPGNELLLFLVNYYNLLTVLLLCIEPQIPWTFPENGGVSKAVEIAVTALRVRQEGVDPFW